MASDAPQVPRAVGESEDHNKLLTTMLETRLVQGPAVMTDSEDDAEVPTSGFPGFQPSDNNRHIGVKTVSV